MIEAKLKEKGVTQSELEAFARKPTHNAKKDVFRILCKANPEQLVHYTDGKFLRRLYEVLHEEGLKNWDQYFPNRSKKFVGKVAGQFVATKMLAKLNDSIYAAQADITLDSLYKETFQ